MAERKEKEEKRRKAESEHDARFENMKRVVKGFRDTCHVGNRDGVSTCICIGASSEYGPELEYKVQIRGAGSRDHPDHEDPTDQIQVKYNVSGRAVGVIEPDQLLDTIKIVTRGNVRYERGNSFIPQKPYDKPLMTDPFRQQSEMNKAAFHAYP